jgi:hypothetical protein
LAWIAIDFADKFIRRQTGSCSPRICSSVAEEVSSLPMRAARLILPAFALAMLAGPALAMPASCQADFQKYNNDRQVAVDRINAFNKKRPTAQAACAAFGNLTGAEARLIKWMTENKDWCQIPEAFFQQIQEAAGQTTKVRGQVCTAAKREAQGAAGGAPRGAPPPGAGVRLPQGAL